MMHRVRSFLDKIEDFKYYEILIGIAMIVLFFIAYGIVGGIEQGSINL